MPLSSITLNPSLLNNPVSSGPMSVASALNAIGTSRSGVASIQDTADNISRNFDALMSVRSRIGAVVISGVGNTLALRTRQLSGSGAVLDKIAGGNYTLSISEANASDVPRLAANTKVSSIALVDSSKNIGSNLAALQAAVGKISEIRQSGTRTALKIDYNALSSSVLEKITDSYSLSVGNVSTGNMNAVSGNSKVAAIGIVDSSQNIADSLDALQRLGVKLIEAQSTDKAVLSVTAEQVRTDALVLGKLYSGYSLAVHGATLTDVVLLSSNNKVKTIDVVDTAANVIKNLDALRKLGKNLGTITLSDADSPITVSASTLSKNGDILSKISNANYRYAVTGASVAALSGQNGLVSNARVSSISVSDTGAKIAAGLDYMQARGSLIVEVNLTDTGGSLAVTESQLTDDSDVLAKVHNRYTLAVSGVLAGHVADLAGRDNVKSIAIADSSSSISDQWNDLIASTLKLKTITQLGARETMDISAAQFAAGRAMLSRVANPFSLNVTGVSAANATGIANTASVVGVTVSDASANIAANLNALNALGNKLGSIKQTSVSALGITATQLASDTNALNKIDDNYTLSVRDVFADNAAAVEAAVIGHGTVTAVQVADTSANIAANLDALQAMNTLTAIKVLGSPAPMAITYDHLAEYSGALLKITNSYSLAVRNVSAELAAGVAAQDHVAQVAVRDSSSNIALHLSALNGLGKELTSITQEGQAAPLELTAAQLRDNGPALGKIVNAYSLKVTGVTAASAASVASMSNVASVEVSDSSANIALHLDALDSLGATLTAISQTGTPASLTVTATQLASASETLAKIDIGEYSVNVREVRAASVASIVADPHVASVDVIDTADNIVAGLGDLKDALSVGSGATVDKLHAVSVSSVAPLSISMAQLQDFGGVGGVLSKITNNHAITVRDVPANDAVGVAGRAFVTYVAVADSSDQIASNLVALNGLGRKLSRVTQTGNVSPLSITATQLAASPTTLAKISNNYTLAVSGVTAAGAAAVGANGAVVSMAVRDTSANIVAKLDSLQTLASKISAITQSTKSALAVTVAQLTADSNALSKISDGYTLNVSGVLAGNAKALADSNGLISTLSVLDSSSSIASSFDSLRDIVAKLGGITQTGVATPLSITQAQADASNGAAVLARITNTWNLSLREVHADDAVTVSGRSHVATVSVADLSDEVSQNLDALHRLGSRLLSVTQTGTAAPIGLTAAQLIADSDVLGKFTNGYTLAVTEATAAQATGIAANPLVSSLEVADTSAHIAANLDVLQGIGSRLVGIAQTGTPSTLQITAGQLREDASTLAKINGTFSLAVSGVNAENAAAVAAQEIGGVDVVSSVAVSDSAKNVASRIDALAALGSELSSVTLSGSETSMDISAAQWTAGTANGEGVLSRGVLDKITNSYSVGVSGVLSEDATLVAGDSHVLTVSVSDTGAGIATQLDALQALGRKLLAITPDTGDAAMSVTLDQLNSDSGALEKINGTFHLNVTEVSAASASSVAARRNVRTVEVSDTAANVARNWDALASLAPQLGSITLSAPTPMDITEAQLERDAAVIEKLPQDGYSLAVSGVKADKASAVGGRADVDSVAVRDTAENISRYVDDLESSPNKVVSVDVSDQGLLTMTSGQYAGGLVGKIPTANNYTLALTGVGVVDALDVNGDIASDAHVVSVSVADSSGSVESSIDLLQAMGGKLKAISLSSAGSMTITADQLFSDAETLAKITDPYSLVVTGVLASDALTVAEVGSVDSLSVSDTAANLSSYLDDLEQVAGKLNVVNISDGLPLTLSFTQMSADTEALNKFDNAAPPAYEVSDVKAENIAALLDRSTDVVTVNVSDTSAAISGVFDDLTTLAASGRLGSIEQVDTIAPLAITATQLDDPHAPDVLGSISNGYHLAVSGVLAANVSQVGAQGGVVSVAVSDSADEIRANLDHLQALGSRLASITQTDVPATPLTVTASQYDLYGDLWGKFTGDVSLAVEGAQADRASYLGGRGDVSSIAVSDTADAVSTHLDDLQALGAQLAGITLTDAPAVLSLTARQLVSDAAALSMISGASLAVADVSAEDAAGVAARSAVSSLIVTDSGTNVSNFLEYLDTPAVLDKLQSITLTDSSTLSLTHDQIESHGPVLAKLASGFTVVEIDAPA